MSHKQGQHVKITAKIHGHEFEIGEIVAITKVEDDQSYRAENANGRRWWINDEECEAMPSDQSNRIKDLEEALTDMVNFSKTWGREWFNDSDWKKIDRARALVEKEKL